MMPATRHPTRSIRVNVPDYAVASKLAAALIVKGWDATYKDGQVIIRDGRSPLVWGTRDYAIGWLDAYMTDGA